VITVPVSLAAGAAWLLAVRRRPYRRDLARLGLLLPLGVIAQAVLGGFTVRGELDYGYVMGHFALSMLILLAAVLLVWRARPVAAEARVAETGAGEAGIGQLETASGASDGARDRRLVILLRALVALGALTIFAGTAATAAGPHAGGSPGQRINRLNLDGRSTMDFVIHRHGEIALAFGLAALGVWWLARRRRAPSAVQRPLTLLCALLALQGLVGLDQYKTHLPTELVWVHVGLACGAWLAALWAACASGAFEPARARFAADRRSKRPVRASGLVKNPGN